MTTIDTKAHGIFKQKTLPDGSIEMHPLRAFALAQVLEAASKGMDGLLGIKASQALKNVGLDPKNYRSKKAKAELAAAIFAGLDKKGA